MLSDHKTYVSRGIVCSIKGPACFRQAGVQAEPVGGGIISLFRHMSFQPPTMPPILVGMCYHTPHILSLIISYLVSICPSPLAPLAIRKPFSRAPKRNADPIEPARELKSFESPFESIGPFFLRRLLSLVWSLLFSRVFIPLFSISLLFCSAFGDQCRPYRFLIPSV